MRNLLVGIAFLLIGGYVYVHNTHTDAVEGKLLLGAFGGPLGETGTAAVLLGMGIFFLLLGSFRWFWNHRAALAMQEFEAVPVELEGGHSDAEQKRPETNAASEGESPAIDGGIA